MMCLCIRIRFALSTYLTRTQNPSKYLLTAFILPSVYKRLDHSISVDILSLGMLACIRNKLVTKRVNDKRVRT